MNDKYGKFEVKYVRSSDGDVLTAKIFMEGVLVLTLGVHEAVQDAAADFLDMVEGVWANVTAK